MKVDNPDVIARCAYEVHRALASATGGPDSPAWADAPDASHTAVVSGVRRLLHDVAHGPVGPAPVALDPRAAVFRAVVLSLAGIPVPATLAVEVPAAAPEGDPLPADFPHAALLAANGFATVQAVAGASDDALIAIDGIGPVRLVEIREALAPTPAAPAKPKSRR